MKKKKIDRIINILYSISAIVILLGALFKLQHFPYGNYLLFGGFLVGIMVGVFKLAISKDY